MAENTHTSKRYWENWDKGEAARRIDAYWLDHESDWRKMLVRDVAAQLGRKMSVLEVGCGSGLIYQQLLRQHLVTPDSYIGGDVSRNMLRIARQRFPETTFIDLDIFNIPYPDQSHPNVICVHVIQHLPHYTSAMQELIRVTGRKLYVVSWFTPALQDELVFSEPSAEWDGQAFQNNCYSLPKFLTFIFESTNRNIQNLSVHHLSGQNYSVSLSFTHPNHNYTLYTKLKSFPRRLRVGLKKFLAR